MSVLTGWLTKALAYEIYGLWVHVVPLKASCTHGNWMRTKSRISEHHGCQDHASRGDIVHSEIWNVRSAMSVCLQERLTVAGGVVEGEILVVLSHLDDVVLTHTEIIVGNACRNL